MASTWSAEVGGLLILMAAGAVVGAAVGWVTAPGAEVVESTRLPVHSERPREPGHRTRQAAGAVPQDRRGLVARARGVIAIYLLQ